MYGVFGRDAMRLRLVFGRDAMTRAICMFCLRFQRDHLRSISKPPVVRIGNPTHLNTYILPSFHIVTVSLAVS